MQLPIAKCLYTKLSEIKGKGDLLEYNANVNPLNYDFGLNVGEDYILLGITQLNSLPYYYILSDNEVDIAPALLFEEAQYKIPKDWVIKISPKDFKTLEILPKFLTDIPNWFEKYLDEDDKVLEIVNDEINKLHPLNNSDRQTSEPEDLYAWPFEEYK